MIVLSWLPRRPPLTLALSERQMDIALASVVNLRLLARTGIQGGDVEATGLTMNTRQGRGRGCSPRPQRGDAPEKCRGLQMRKR